MKKIVSLITCLVLSLGTLAAFSGCKKTPREEILKIFMPGEYIDEDIFDEFKKWYKEQTDKKITVELKTFETVEQISREVEVSKADYDLICPSDYMVEYLISKNLLNMIDKNVIDVEEEGLFKEEYLATSREFDPDLKYCVPYMYGTLGLVYDKTKTSKEINSWSSFFGDEYAGQKSLKKSMRDAYAAACLFNAGETLKTLDGAEKKAAVQAVFNDTSDETLAKAETALKKVRSDSVWDNDNIKFEMADGSSSVAVALMWSCDAGYVMNDYDDAAGNKQKGNRNLWYVVPEEGGNVYIDCFCISKYAVNTEAANYFLKFLCTTEIAVKNCDFAGCISPVAEAYEEMYAYYADDEDGIFEGVDEAWKKMFIETMFPSEDTLNRCGVMKDFKNANDKVVELWGKVSGD